MNEKPGGPLSFQGKYSHMERNDFYLSAVYIGHKSLPQTIVCLQEVPSAQTLKTSPSQKQQERLDIEEKYTSLQEEAQGKTKKLKKVWTMLMAAKSEVRTT